MGFKPRDGNQVIAGIPWLARMIDKARAKAEGRLGDYIYPCVRDQRLLAELGLTAEKFSRIVVESDDDRAVINRIHPNYRRQ
ncbi:MAG: DUF5069 domain-containing protein [Firmicutes bacterium]|nr:DUF5069 domain-containing protein [Bacillota bacterium]